jgi:hypothetical protein
MYRPIGLTTGNAPRRPRPPAQCQHHGGPHIPSPRSITFWKEVAPGVRRLPDDCTVLAAHQTAFGPQTRVWWRLGRGCTSKCALRVAGPTAIFHVNAPLRASKAWSKRWAYRRIALSPMCVSQPNTCGICYSACSNTPRHGAAATPPAECRGVSPQGQQPAGHSDLVWA